MGELICLKHFSYCPARNGPKTKGISLADEGVLRVKGRIALAREFREQTRVRGGILITPGNL